MYGFRNVWSALEIHDYLGYEHKRDRFGLHHKYLVLRYEFLFNVYLVLNCTLCAERVRFVLKYLFCFECNFF